jgi:transcriptional regulator GlxA family with amidase domain
LNRKRVGILIFPSVEILDFCGPFEVFSATRLHEEQRRGESSPFEVLVVAEERGVTVTSGGLKVIPNCTPDDCPPLDILVVPGGWGVRTEINNARLLDWIGDQGRRVETLASVCTGAMLLGKARLLDGKWSTTHWKSLGRMRESLPNVTVVEDQHVVEDGDVLTSAGNWATGRASGGSGSRKDSRI